MGAFFVYIIKSAVCLALFYLFYRLLLSKETFHRFNRFAIVGILLLSLIIPFIEITIYQPAEISQGILTLEQLLLFANLNEVTDIQSQESTVAIWIKATLAVYICGILFFICRNLYALAHMIRLLKNSPRQKLKDGIILILHHKDNLAPFSWMKYIAIPAKDYEENGTEILIHEIAHIEKRHSVDMLLAELCIFFQWFNPAAWLLKQELQNIHEYEADETVIKKGIDAKQYQLLLIKKAVGTRLYSMANSFNHSKLKKRITMMLKEKSSPWARLKYLYVLPVAAIAVTAFARPEISNELKEISAVKVNDLATILPPNEVKNDTTIWYIQDSPIQTASLPNGELPKVEVTHTTIVSKTVSESMGFIPQEIITDFEKEQDPVRMHIRNEDGKEPLIIIDGKEVSGTVLSALDPDKIESISVLKDKASVEQYGEKGANGIIIVDLKKGEHKISQTDVKALPNGVLVLLDGKETDVKAVDPSIIESINVIKGTDVPTAYTHQYGDKAKDGVILITSKNGAADKDIVVVGGKKTDDHIKVSGKVVDENNKPVVGASVLIIGTNVGTITDLDGNFILMAAEGSELSIGFIDMKTKRVKVKKEKMTVKLEKE